MKPARLSCSIVAVSVLTLWCSRPLLSQGSDGEGAPAPRGQARQDAGGPGGAVPPDPSVKRTPVQAGRATGFLYQPAVPGEKARIGVFVMHFGSDYSNFSACSELSRRGYTVLCTKNSGGGLNDILPDARSSVEYLRKVGGVRKVVLWGHSGGATLMTAYQLMAENGVKACQGPEKISKCPGSLAGMPAADGIILADANWGNAEMTLLSLDPAVTDEGDAATLDESVNLFNPKNGYNAAGNSNYSPEFVKKWQSAVGRRNNVILASMLQKAAALGPESIDDPPVVVYGANSMGPNNKLFPQDVKLLAHTVKPWPLIHADGSLTTQVVHSVRVPSGRASSPQSGALNTTARRYLVDNAIRVTNAFGYDESSVYGVEWASSYASTPGNVEQIRVPSLFMGMTGGYEYLAAETIYEHSAASDKSLAFAEGATHGYGPCRQCETTPGQFGDTIKTLYDYADRWLGQEGRFVAAQPGPTVSVTGGRVRGHALQSGAVFKGIPFAAPPVGELRWRPPAPVVPWRGVRDAVEYGATCAQIDAGWNQLAASRGREDCLFLNVWTPEWPPTVKHAVMMWIHGGGNQGGSALGLGGIEPSFDGEAISKHGVVFVSVQYRLGILGFLAHPELTAESPHHSSGNYAVQDQIAALKWIRENIARFGGDPANVTVFGQSAGGNDTGQLLVSPLSVGLFARAIEESGTVVGSGRITPGLAEAEQSGVSFARKMGAPATGAPAYMRKLPVEAVLKAEPPYGTGGVGPNADGYVIEDVPARTFAAGQQKKVPLMIGSTARERSLDGGPEAVKKAVADFYGDLVSKALDFYTTKASTYPPYGDGGAQFATDTMNRCPSIAIEEFHASAGNVVWAYEFSHAFPEATRGASHSGELRYVFGNFPPGDVAVSERKTSGDTQSYWANYAKTGDPNGGGLPAWPRFDVKARRYLEFTDVGPVAKANLRGDACALFIDFLKRKIAAPSRAGDATAQGRPR